MYATMTQKELIFIVDTPKIDEKVNSFFNAFNKLSSDEKLYFIAEIDKALTGKDGSERKLYLAMIKAAREGKTCEETILELKKV